MRLVTARVGTQVSTTHAASLHGLQLLYHDVFVLHNVQLPLCKIKFLHLHLLRMKWVGMYCVYVCILYNST